MASPRSVDKGYGAPPAPQGHFSLKSSPFNAVSGKLTTQSLVVDHMKAHYKKLVKAKPAIDSGVPISYLRSQKVRDRRRREAMVRGDYRPSSASAFATPRHSSQPGSARSYASSRQGGSAVYVDGAAEGQEAAGGAATTADHGYEKYWNDANDETLGYEVEHQRQLAKYARAISGNTTLNSRLGYRGGSRDVNSKTILDGGTIGWPPQSARSADASSGTGSCKDSSNSVSRGQQLALAKDTSLRRGMSADILDKRHHKFTEPVRDFTPRTLKKDVQSRLSSYKYYNRPVKSSAEPLRSTAATASPEDDLTRDAADSVILDETLLSRDFERGSSIDHGTVPPLEMSLDTDHMKWLKENSAERRLRSRPTPQANGGTSGQGTHTAGRTTASSPLPYGAPLAKPRKSLGAAAAAAVADSKRLQMSREDEELMYLNFVTQVTNDILTRGVFSDRVLKQVFEEHIARQRGNLDEVQMRGLLDTLRDDLGIPSEQSSESCRTVGETLQSSVISSSSTTGRSHIVKQMNNQTGSFYAVPKSDEAPSDSAFLKADRNPAAHRTSAITDSIPKVTRNSDVQSGELEDDVVGEGGESDGETSEIDRMATKVSDDGDIKEVDDCNEPRLSSPDGAIGTTGVNHPNDVASDELQQECGSSMSILDSPGASTGSEGAAAAGVDEEEYSDSYEIDEESLSKS